MDMMTLMGIGILALPLLVALLVGYNKVQRF